METFSPMENIAAQKTSLKRSAEDYKSALSNQIEHIKANAAQYGKTILIVGGVIFVTYKLIRMLSSRDEDEVEVKVMGGAYPAPVYTGSRGGRSIFDMIKEQIALFIIAIAKEKLVKYLETLEIFKQPTEGMSAKK